MQAAKFLTDATQSIADILGETSLVDSLELTLATRPLHGLLKAQGSINIFGMPMALTLVFQAHAVQLLNTLGTNTACSSGKAIMASKVESSGFDAKAQEKNLKDNLFGFAVSLTKGSSSKGEGLGPFIKRLLKEYIPAKIANTIAGVLRIFDKVELGLMYTGPTSLQGLTKEFALPAPFASGTSTAPGLHIKASISNKILPTRDTSDCNVICDLMHQFFKVTGGGKAAGSSLAVTGIIIVGGKELSEDLSGDVAGGDDDEGGGQEGGDKGGDADLLELEGLSFQFSERTNASMQQRYDSERTKNQQLQTSLASSQTLLQQSQNGQKQLQQQLADVKARLSQSHTDYEKNKPADVQAQDRILSLQQQLALNVAKSESLQAEVDNLVRFPLG